MAESQFWRDYRAREERLAHAERLLNGWLYSGSFTFADLAKITTETEAFLAGEAAPGQAEPTHAERVASNIKQDKPGQAEGQR